jgi:hypothetical protein
MSTWVVGLWVRNQSSVSCESREVGTNMSLLLAIWNTGKHTYRVNMDTYSYDGGDVEQEERVEPVRLITPHP